MATIAEVAKDYKSTTTKNIADLDKVSTKLELTEDSFDIKDDVTGQMKTIKQQVVIINDEKFRVPVSVIQQLQILLVDNKELQFFKVKKTGTNKDNTKYQCIPLLA